MAANARDCQWRSGQTKYEEEEIVPIVASLVQNYKVSVHLNLRPLVQ